MPIETNRPGNGDLAASDLRRTGFHAEVQPLESSVLVRLHGELDMATAPALGRTLHTALGAGPSILALDLRELTFVDSTGIRVLITACRQAEKAGCRFVLRSPSRSVRKALLLTGVDRLMAIEPGDGEPRIS